jgi:hypothetical protein
VPSWIVSWKSIVEHAKVMVSFTIRSSMLTSAVELLHVMSLALEDSLTHIGVYVI